MRPERLQFFLRRAVLIAAVLGLLYLFWRFEFLRLPEDRCSPLLNTPPGTALILDTQASAYAAGDIVLYETPTAVIGLGMVQRVEGQGDASRYWIIKNDPDCEVPDSDDWGWIPRSSLEARLILSGFL